MSLTCSLVLFLESSIFEHHVSQHMVLLLARSNVFSTMHAGSYVPVSQQHVSTMLSPCEGGSPQSPLGENEMGRC